MGIGIPQGAAAGFVGQVDIIPPGYRQYFSVYFHINIFFVKILSLISL